MPSTSAATTTPRPPPHRRVPHRSPPGPAHGVHAPTNGLLQYNGLRRLSHGHALAAHSLHRPAHAPPNTVNGSCTSLNGSPYISANGSVYTSTNGTLTFKNKSDGTKHGPRTLTNSNVANGSVNGVGNHCNGVHSQEPTAAAPDRPPLRKSASGPSLSSYGFSLTSFLAHAAGLGGDAQTQSHGGDACSTW